MSLEVVVGPMFSGKSSYALSYVRRQRAIGKKVLVIKPDIDNRYSKDSVLVTHDKDTIPCVLWTTMKPLSEMDDLYYDCYVIEEAQFFLSLPDFCYQFVLMNKKDVLVAGLDGCAKQKKFGEILDVIPMATSVTKLNALCSVCKNGTLAPFTKKVSGDNTQVDVGGAEKYLAVCLNHL
jgi:thymidine kinase